jgi:hypothetical protein
VTFSFEIISNSTKRRLYRLCGLRRKSEETVPEAAVWIILLGSYEFASDCCVKVYRLNFGLSR